MLKDRNIFSISYIIEPKYKKRWFRKGKTVYNLFKIEIGKRWSDSSYGNGGGNFVEFEDKIKIEQFDYLYQAKYLKQQLEL